MLLKIANPSKMTCPPAYSEIAKNEGLHHSVVNELMRLTLLAPDIITQLMSGAQPRRFNLMWFQRNRLPVDWLAQRAIINCFK